MQTLHPAESHHTSLPLQEHKAGRIIWSRGFGDPPNLPLILIKYSMSIKYFNEILLGSKLDEYLLKVKQGKLLATSLNSYLK